MPASTELVPVWKLAADSGGQQGLRALGLDSKGNVVVTGFFSGPMSFGGAQIDAPFPIDVFFGRLDPTGKQLSLAAYTGQGQEAPWFVAMDGDRAICGGEYSDDLAFGPHTLPPGAGGGTLQAFVAAFDAAVPAWAEGYGPSQGELTVYGIAVDPQTHAIYIVGTHEGPLDIGTTPELPGNGDIDMFIAKLDATGKALWSKTFGDTNEQQARRVAVDPQGNVVFVGYNGGAVDFGGGPLVSQSNQALVVAKLDSNGKHLWSKQYGDSFTLPQGIACDAKGDIVIAGTLGGTLDFGGGKKLEGSPDDDDMFVAKVTADGAFVWGTLVGGVGAQQCNAMSLDPDGNVLVAGDFQGSTSIGGATFTDVSTCGTNCFDVLLAKLAPDGTHLWSHGFGSAGDDSARAIAAGPGGVMVVGGYFGGSADFGDGKSLTGPDGALYVVEYGLKK
jgi:hypothetical protein